MLWWIWLIAGFVLLAMELFVPSGFVLFVVGVSAVITGLMISFGLIGSAAIAWLLCAVLSIVLVFYVRKYLPGKANALGFNGQVGQEVVLKETVLPGQIGQGEMRGSLWSVKNVGDGPLTAGQRYRVEACDGLTLKVRT